MKNVMRHSPLHVRYRQISRTAATPQARQHGIAGYRPGATADATMPGGLPAGRALGIGVSHRRDDLLCRRQPAAQCMPPAGRASGPTTRAAREAAPHRGHSPRTQRRREARTRKICGTVRPGGSTGRQLHAVPRHAVLTARRYPWVQLMAARNSIAATTTHITTMRTARRPRGTRIPGSVSVFGVVIGVTPAAGVRGSRSPGRRRPGCGEEAARPRRRRPVRWWRRPGW